MNNFAFSLKNMEKTSEKYLEKFDILKVLLVNEKLIVYNNILYLDESYYLIQPFKRWLMVKTEKVFVNI